MKLKPEDVAYLDGFLSAFDDLPDGAWSWSCQNAIENDSRFKGRDAYEVWLAWCMAHKTVKP